MEDALLYNTDESPKLTPEKPNHGTLTPPEKPNLGTLTPEKQNHGILRPLSSPGFKLQGNCYCISPGHIGTLQPLRIGGAAASLSTKGKVHGQSQNSQNHERTARKKPRPKRAQGQSSRKSSGQIPRDGKGRFKPGRVSTEKPPKQVRAEKPPEPVRAEKPPKLVRVRKPAELIRAEKPPELVMTRVKKRPEKKPPPPGGERNATIWRCEFCPRSFASRTGLYCHRPYHTGEWKFRCWVCYKGFMTNQKCCEHIPGCTHRHQELLEKTGLKWQKTDALPPRAVKVQPEAEREPGELSESDQSAASDWLRR